ncbi:hypothetical protein O9K63_05910 [Janibacter cremeus]|uniref:hypothetical protein n=1 Tax=Janibacter cremeus TaxID=1285192 RepID=UPI0023F7CE00|nr:hypothetical protein [Janibacter cremeus]WEV79324.1 hypothetical protein O9K63_05910 [Janibacter cremeus]
MGNDKLLGWCSSCRRLNVSAGDSAPEVILDDYRACQYCSGVSLPLPARFSEYAVPAWSILTSQERAGALPLAELGRAIGQARAQRVEQRDERTPSDPIAIVCTTAPCLEALLIRAHQHGDLRVALLALWLLVGELHVATDDPSVGGAAYEGEEVARATHLRHVISELATSR